MTGVQWQPVNQAGHLYERVVNQITRLIEERSLQPGDRLPPERELAQLLGVSRPSLREAVKTLEALGHLEVRHGLGVTVRSADRLGDTLRAGLVDREIGLQDLFAMREVLEVPAAGWAAVNCEPGHVAGLEAILAELADQAALLPPDFASLRDLDARFHLQIAEIAANRFLTRTMGVLRDMLDTGMETTLSLPGRLARSARDHRRIIEAIVAGDSGAAKRAMRAHIRGAQAAALRRLRDGGIQL